MGGFESVLPLRQTWKRSLAAEVVVCQPATAEPVQLMFAGSAVIEANDRLMPERVRRLEAAGGDLKFHNWASLAMASLTPCQDRE